MARGGNRPGAGRKPGSPNKATAKLQAEVAASGVTPLDFLLKLMRDDDQPMDMRTDAAKAAAPYVHPKLAAIEHSGAVGLLSHEDMLNELDGEGKDSPA